MAWWTHPRNETLVYQQLSLHLHYITVTLHSDSRSDSSTYMTSHVQYTTYKIIACIERATVLRDNIMRVTRKYKAGEGVLSYSRLTN